MKTSIILRFLTIPRILKRRNPALRSIFVRLFPRFLIGINNFVPSSQTLSTTIDDFAVLKRIIKMLVSSFMVCNFLKIHKRKIKINSSSPENRRIETCNLDPYQSVRETSRKQTQTPKKRRGLFTDQNVVRKNRTLTKGSG